ncbi:MAG: hypothetical protein GTN70_07415 [Deltaproteobacteria bacterium]|nr:hypothetical protein [Deltaproteobacteria bacterium]NIS77525.1 hypothetical protein [Deltaproteobacteria bacterium]
MIPVRVCLAIFLISICSVHACTHTGKSVADGAHQKTRDDNRGPDQKVGIKSDFENQEKMAYLVRKKSYANTLDGIRKGVDGGRKEVSFGDDYVSALNGRIAEGKRRMKGEDFESSGLLFRSVIEMYPKTKELRSRVKEKPEQIVAYINLSSEKLMEVGMSHYREGNLGNAIRTWRKVLRFNPDYAEAVKAIETATVQLKNLKSLKRKDKEQ